MFTTLLLSLFIATILSQDPLGLTYLDKNCYRIDYNTVWFEVDISPKYQLGKDEGFKKWYDRKDCLRDSKECCVTCRQYCTHKFRVKIADSIDGIKNLIAMNLTSTHKERDYLFTLLNIGASNYLLMDLRQGLRSIIVSMNNLHPDDQSHRQVFQTKMAESIVAKILNNTNLYNKDAQTIQSNSHVLSIDKICLLANYVLRTTAKRYDFSNCFKLITKMETQSTYGFDTGLSYFCRANMDSNKASTSASCLRNLPMINISKMIYNNKVLDIMREVLVKGLDAIPYAGKFLATTTNAI